MQLNVKLSRVNAKPYLILEERLYGCNSYRSFPRLTGITGWVSPHSGHSNWTFISSTALQVKTKATKYFKNTCIWYLKRTTTALWASTEWTLSAKHKNFPFLSIIPVQVPGQFHSACPLTQKCFWRYSVSVVLAILPDGNLDANKSDSNINEQNVMMR